MFVFFFKQKTAYEMRISDWSSDVCSSDLLRVVQHVHEVGRADQLLLAIVEPQQGLHPGHAVEPGQAVDVDDRLEQQQQSRLLQRQIGRASCRERVWQYV